MARYDHTPGIPAHWQPGPERFLESIYISHEAVTIDERIDALKIFVGNLDRDSVYFSCQELKLEFYKYAALQMRIDRHKAIKRS
jgi:hypothetical protein